MKQETYQDAFLRLANLDPLECQVADLCRLSNQLGVDADWSSDKDDWLNLIFASVVQPGLGLDSPTILTHYPASQSALAQLSEEDSRVSERFELFIDGIELANGYHELLDANTLLQRNVIANEQRQADDKQPLPTQSRLLEAMRAGLTACSGCALGIDRLIMTLLGKKSIDQVMAFTVENS